jgi:outer membrane protein assembly factor BamE
VRSFNLYSTIRLASLAFVLTILAGCASDRWGFPYTTGVQQGNWVTSGQVRLLSAGMTPEQVRFALGSPTLTSIFRANQWVYPYFYQSPSGKTEERNLTVYFENGVLAKWQGAELPEVQPFQIAKEEVFISQQEAEKVKLEQERMGTAAEAGILLSPSISIEPSIGVSSDPSAAPDEPDETPAQLN